MAKRRRAAASDSGFSPLAAMLFGLAIGLSVAFAVYMKDRRPEPPAARPEPASLKSAIDDNGEFGTEAPPADVRSADSAAAKSDAEEDKAVQRFTFYDILPNFEMVTPEEEPVAASSSVPSAIVEPGLYVLQAGSFSTHEDADRRRAELALHGIESHIQRVKVNDRNYHRVYIGPTEDLDELNLLRSRLRAAQIDVLRIRLGD
jgi:cell division protein FtsN